MIMLITTLIPCSLPPSLDSEVQSSRLQLVIVSPVFLQWVASHPAYLVGQVGVKLSVIGGTQRLTFTNIYRVLSSCHSDPLERASEQVLIYSILDGSDGTEG